MADFRWTDKANGVAVMLAEGHTQQEAADRYGVSRRTVERWHSVSEFREEVDKLSLMVGIAHRGARLRLVQRVVRARISESGAVITEKDLLEWLKYAQSETDGIKLDLPAAFNAAVASLAGSGQASSSESDGADSQGT
jgi:transposase